MSSLFSGKNLQNIYLKVLTIKPEQSYCIAQPTAGFTLIEMLVVVLMIGILSAMALPRWVGFFNRQQANKANDVLLAALQQAQREAKTQKLSYSVSFSMNNNIPQIAVYPKNGSPSWQSLASNTDIQSGKIVLLTNINNNSYNTINSSNSVSSLQSGYTPTITFDYTGALEDLSVATNTNSLTAEQQQKLGYNSTTQSYKGLIVAVAVPQPGNSTQSAYGRRCVIVKTLLGSIQTGKDTDCQ